MLAGVVAAIMVLAPAKVVDAAVLYADSILLQASDQNIDPLIIVATIHVETGGQWDSTLISKTNDYGLMMVHVSRTTNATYLGREKELFNPDTNIMVGVQMLSFWKRYHKKHCKSGHKWWAHYQAGCAVKSDKYSRKIARVYARVKRINFLSQEGQFDRSHRGSRCQWQSHSSSSSSRRIPTALNSHLIPKVQWSFWGSDPSTPKRRSSSGQEECCWGLVNLSERRRGIPSIDDNGQV